MLYPLFIGTVGIPELLIIGFLMVLLFGAKKVPQLMRGVGQGIKELKDGITHGEKD